MDTLYLKHIVTSDPKLNKIFLGVFPSDRLPITIESYPAALIANVDTHDKSGSHWVAFYFNKSRQGEFFDSYGRHPARCSPLFETFLKKFSVTWTYNKKSLQSFWSTVCGQYCLYYLLRRARRNSMASIISTFNHNRTQNDKKVHASIRLRCQKHKAPIHDSRFILKQIAKSLN